MRNNDLVGRIGGDEFVVVLDIFEGVEFSTAVIEKIHTQVVREVDIDNINIQPGCSIGIAVFPEDGESCDELINNADRAMYRAKELGKNRVQFFTAEMNSQLERRRQIEFDLQQAISLDQFRVFYQPQFCFKQNKTVKFEALVRWQHPGRGLVSPDEFVSIAENSGQIIEIGNFVMQQVCEDYSHLQRTYPELKSVSVNFSARQFGDPSIVSYLPGIMKANHLKHECIEMEITESVFIDSEDKIIVDSLYRLRDNGFKIALDDFGTGYSSLAYLKQFPVDILKVDRSFIQDLTENPQSRALVSSIIDLAQHFHLTVVGEGIETEAQQEVLKQLNCDLGQGYYYSKPKSLSEILKLGNNGFETSVSPDSATTQ